MQRQTTVFLAILAIGLALAAIWVMLRPAATAVNHNLLSGIGVVLAEETTKAAQDRGSVVAVMYGDPAHPETPADDRWDGFQAELKKHDALQVAKLELVQPNPNENNGMPGCPPKALEEILQRHPEAAVVVFFVDLPDWNLVKTFLSEKSGGPKIVVQATIGIRAKDRYTGYFSSGRLAALILARREIGAGAADTNPSREAFHKFYQVYTLENYDSLPD